ncbi:EI24 domain-containing protein [Yonghaparkia sp. Root332]|uniref:EI24 domain-containing protein n=1 Tax=Yonghaparkia sp. Root332 TaxID=1736516 RepID=UPI000A5D3593|nr:EI24 domain-containing protein [Yonghaparkia sp. Root332]
MIRRRDAAPRRPGSSRPARLGIAGELLAGAGLLWRGFGMWRRRPGVMALGMVPAAIVAAVVIALVIALTANVAGIGAWLTPFAESWGENERELVRGAAGTLVVVGLLVLALSTFTTLTLLVGDPFYERIWRRAEADLGAHSPAPFGFWRSVGDAILLVLRAIGYGLTTLAVGLIPVVGAVAGPVVGALLGGHLIARELTQRPFQARGMGRDARRELLRGSRARELGFGVMTQLTFLIPGGAIIVMPAAVVGSTLLARELMERAGTRDGALETRNGRAQDAAPGRSPAAD